MSRRFSLQAKFGRVADSIVEEVTKQIEKEAERLSGRIDQVKPLPVDGTNVIEVGWGWGDDIPRGALRTKSAFGNKYDKLSVVVWERGPTGSGWDARWFEFGTKDRYTKTGKFTGQMPIQPHFFPTYRAYKTNIVGNISRSVTRGLKKEKAAR